MSNLKMQVLVEEFVSKLETAIREEALTAVRAALGESKPVAAAAAKAKPAAAAKKAPAKAAPKAAPAAKAAAPAAKKAAPGAPKAKRIRRSIADLDRDVGRLVSVVRSKLRSSPARSSVWRRANGSERSSALWRPSSLAPRASVVTPRSTLPASSRSTPFHLEPPRRPSSRGFAIFVEARALGDSGQPP